MNLDVAKPQQASSSSSWGSSSGNRERNSRPSFNRDRDRERDTAWGPGPGSRDNKDNRPPSFNRPPPSTERPKLNTNTPKPPQSPRDPPKNKPSSESIFGKSINEDEVKKMNKIAEDRVKREMEREAHQRKELENRDREREKVNRNPRTSGRGDTQPEDSRFNSSWRGNKPGGTTVKPPFNTNFRQDDTSRPAGRGPQKSVVDSEGFRGQTSRPTGHNRAWENQGPSSARARDPETQTKNQNPKESQNKFGILDGDEE